MRRSYQKRNMAYRAGPSTSSSTCLGLAHKWFTQCHDQHSSCFSHCPLTTDGRTFCPSRLTDVSPSGSDLEKWRLHIASDEGINGLYVTLSHYWGSSQSLRLTSSTLKSMESGSGMSCLPKTFRDAILLAGVFKIRYIWIDSLCIYSHRTATKHLGIMRFAPQVFEGFNITTYLCSKTRQFSKKKRRSTM